MDAYTAETAFNALKDWINAPVTNVIKFGPGISLSDLSIQMTSPPTSFNVPSTFVVAVGGKEGMVFNMLPPDLAAGATPPPPPVDIVFEFQDDTGATTATATLADVLGLPADGVAGEQTGSEDGDFLVGSLARDQIYGNGGDDRVDAGGGDDGVYGGAGNDVLAGGAGMDIIFGDQGDDVIAGGRDGASVSGGTGNDVYLINAGDGALFVDNAPGMEAGEVDTISFGGGIAPQNVMAYIDAYWGPDVVRARQLRPSPHELVRCDYRYRWQHHRLRTAAGPGGRQRTVCRRLGQRPGIRPGAPGRGQSDRLVRRHSGSSGGLVRPGQRRDHRHGRSGRR